MTSHEAYQIARQYGLVDEVKYWIDRGFTPEEALQEWDLLPDDLLDRE